MIPFTTLQLYSTVMYFNHGTCKYMLDNAARRHRQLKLERSRTFCSCSTTYSSSDADSSNSASPDDLLVASACSNGAGPSSRSFPCFPLSVSLSTTPPPPGCAIVAVSAVSPAEAGVTSSSPSRSGGRASTVDVGAERAGVVEAEGSALTADAVLFFSPFVQHHAMRCACVGDRVAAVGD